MVYKLLYSDDAGCIINIDQGIEAQVEKTFQQFIKMSVSISSERIAIYHNSTEQVSEPFEKATDDLQWSGLRSKLYTAMRDTLHIQLCNCIEYIKIVDMYTIEQKSPAEISSELRLSTAYIDEVLNRARRIIMTELIK
jgi:hypothetical protein